MDVVNHKMRILYITGLYLPVLEKEIIEEGKEKCLQVAANNLQWALVKGLGENNVTTEVISCPFLPCWLHGYNHLFTPSIFHQYSPHVAIKSLKYCTCLGVKNFSIRNSIEQYAERWIKENSNDSLYIVVYHTIGYVMKAIANIKRRYPTIKTAIVIADLFYSNPYKIKEPIKRFLYDLDLKKIKYNYRYFDKFILLSKEMSTQISQAQKNYLVVEGIWNSTIYSKKNRPTEWQGNFCILYTGVLEKYSGIIEFCKAFMITNDKRLRLFIYGSGSCIDEILEMQRIDNRIKYCGRASHDDILSLLASADLLVNPRQPVYELTKYSFPSKTIEYMASGTPMIGFKLPGIPDQYYDYMFVWHQNTPEYIAEKIQTISEMPDTCLEQMGDKAQKFIQKEKNPKAQVRKIISYLCEE